MDMKWYAVMMCGIALAVALMYGVEMYENTTAMKNGCSQVVEMGVTLWKCEKK